MAEILAGKLTSVAGNVELKRIPFDPDPAGFDFLFICFPVHAFNPPEPVLRWARELPRAAALPAVILSVSGGGAVWPNRACRVPLVRALEKRDYNVCYEEMIVMPSNWVIATDAEVAATLINVLPERLGRLVRDLEESVSRRAFPGLFSRLTTVLGRLENRGAKRFGTRIVVEDSCIYCGKCAETCPVDNIVLDSGPPVFGPHCTMCLGCIYICPVKALRPGTLKFVVLKQGYSLKSFRAADFIGDRGVLEEKTKGWVWHGVRQYLTSGK